jgi:uncharacterized protein (TIGR02266 family)
MTGQIPQPSSSPLAAPGKRKILLVDDSELFLELEATFFSRMGELETLVARNGQQALEAIRREKPDLVYLDLSMPDIPGDECCRIIKQDPDCRRIPVVMVTGGGREEDFERCWQAGCDDIIVKPINPNQFIAMARKYLQVALRTAPRYANRLKVTYCSSGSRQQLLTDYTVNISTGGVFLETSAPLPVDTRLHLEIQLPGEENPLCARARVAWTNDAYGSTCGTLPEGMGLQFVEITLQDLHALRAHLQQMDAAPP